MKIVHICLGSNFTDGLTYQENFLIKENLKRNDEVLIITNDMYFENGVAKKASEVGEITELYSGCNLLRLKFVKYPFISNKIRKVKGLYEVLKNFCPDTIFFHGICSFELLTCNKYKEMHPNVFYVVDNHATKDNSAQNLLSEIILHKIIYRYFYKKSENKIDRMFYLDNECKKFMINHYKVKKENLYFFPLGGNVIEDDEYYKSRKNYRNILGVSDNQIVIFHSGKFDKLKKTCELLSSFNKVNRDDLLLVIGGVFNNEIKEEAELLMSENDKIVFLGWLDKNQLSGYLDACDLYAQPGSQSATFENSLCHRCPALIYPDEDYYSKYFKECTISVETESEIRDVLLSISKRELDSKSLKSYEVAKKYLDYSNTGNLMYPEEIIK
ncbi:MAG: hypothetical protein RR945_04475 [Erysipelotrichaceae bacterium]